MLEDIFSWGAIQLRSADRVASVIASAQAKYYYCP